ncbi:hypothetical protein EV121DRAFT_296791 [Schizophyllum commune]
MVTTRKAISPHEARKVVQLPVEVKQKQETDVSQPVGCAHPVVYLAPVTNLYTAPVIFKTLVMFGEQGRALFVGPVMQVIMASTAHANMEAEGRVRKITDRVPEDSSSQAGAIVRPPPMWARSVFISRRALVAEYDRARAVAGGSWDTSAGAGTSHPIAHKSRHHCVDGTQVRYITHSNLPRTQWQAIFDYQIGALTVAGTHDEKLTETVCDKSTKRIPWFHLDEIAGGDGNAGDEVEG